MFSVQSGVCRCWEVFEYVYWNACVKLNHFIFGVYVRLRHIYLFCAKIIVFFIWFLLLLWWFWVIILSKVKVDMHFYSLIINELRLLLKFY